MSLQITDTRTIQVTPEAAYRVISDMRTYSKWWPRAVWFKPLLITPDKIGSRIQLCAMGWPPIRYEMIEAKENQSVTMKYYHGSYRGLGIWRLKPVSEGRTEVSYEVNLQISNPLTRFILTLFNAKGIHSFIVQRAIQGLEDFQKKYLV